ncbi:glycosyltransferase domain protein [Mycobacterium xenopi 4042]|uniref:Glycosyltransferase domain protein n=1 Tax=Mycobacterium xenopi 4042 TaxID=1299334 RepID=X8EYE4_MYCXE|nr:glycosyltransferase domain protein [Mycobacterium xenopi 4042]
MSIDVFCRRAALEVDDLRGAIELVCPDVVIVDANCWGAMSFADAKTLRWGVFSPFTPFLRSPACRHSVQACGHGRHAGPDPGRRRAPVVAHLFDRRILPPLNAIRSRLGARQSGRSTSFYVEHRCCWPWVANRWNTRTRLG